jgi:hypothetical protein
MIEVKFSDLKVNQIYYIDMTGVPRNYACCPHPYYGIAPRKIKAICSEILPYGSVRFICYTGLKSTEFVEDKYSSWLLTDYHNKFYMPSRDAIIEKWEKDTVNALLQNIMGDPLFTYV